MKAMKDLFDTSLITEDEYTQKNDLSLLPKNSTIA